MYTRKSVISMISFLLGIVVYCNTLAFSGDTVIDVNDYTIKHFLEQNRSGEIDFEHWLISNVSPNQLRIYHDALCYQPHVAGSRGDYEAADYLVRTFKQFALDVDKQEVWTYLSRPISAKVEIVSPVNMQLPIKEDVLEEDKYSSHPDLTFGWNAYSGSGEVVAEVVYANYGTKADFAKLKEMNIDCTGKIVITRYGGNFRGYKAKFAEQAGAAGLIIYTDPADSGYAQGEMYPLGGFANPSYIQRGSIITLPYPGDPLTPFIPATQYVNRINPDANEFGLPTIPVQPLGWVAAKEILSRMTGSETLPEGWQGGLEFDYKITGGQNLKVKLQVKQKREIVKVYNVIATLKGAVKPDEVVVVGAHYDAWSFGAGDPDSGTIAVIEAARLFAQSAKDGNVPQRTIKFACWAAEEFGIIGSTEWVEANQVMLSENGVAYINLDMASMGLNFGASAAPVLKDLIIDATRYIEQPVKMDLKTESAFDFDVDTTLSIYETWKRNINNPDKNENNQETKKDENIIAKEPDPGNLGGGSDHLGFYCYIGMPSTAIGSGGAPGVSYHSNYDNLTWYRKIVGDDYMSAAMITQVTSIVTSRLANADFLPFNPVRYATDTRVLLNNFVERCTKAGLVNNSVDKATAIASDDKNITTDTEFTAFYNAIDEYELSARKLNTYIQDYDTKITSEHFNDIQKLLLGLERSWIYEPGIPDRPWFKNLFVAPDEDSGYAAWMLPGLKYALEHDDKALLQEMIIIYTRVFENMNNKIKQVITIIEK